MGLCFRKLLDAVMPGRKAPRRARARPSCSKPFRPSLAQFSWGALAFLVLGTGLAEATTYVYDGNGRLRAVTNSTGASAEYVYDAMGNLLQVESVPANQLAVFAFTPSHGAVGTTVTISGQGFSTTPTNDAVTFNGTAASVTAATTTTLTTNVPIGATTGKISVTVGSQSATSDDVFTVDTTGQAPVVTSFSPAIGPIGTPVTVLGQHVDPVPNQTYAAINDTKITPTSVNDTQAQFTVAALMGSGKVSITTPFGQGVSTGDFYVLPPNACGNSAANVKVTKRIAVGQSTGAMTIPAGDCAAILFDANAGAWLSFQGSAISSSASINYTIYDVRNHAIASGTVSSSNPSIHPPRLQVSGTYSIWLSSGTATATATLGLEADAMPPLNGAPVNLSTNIVDQTKRLTFINPVAGNVSLGLSNISTGGAYVVLHVYNSSGSLINDEYCTSSETTCGLDFPNLPAGTYQVIASPWGNFTMSFTAEVSQDLTGTLSLNTPKATTIQRYGQTETWNFSATAGQTVALEASSVATTPSGNSVYYYVSTPDGKSYTNFYTSSYGLLNLANLPQTGTYTVYAVPNYGAELSGQLELLTGVTGTLAIDGPSQNFSTPATGQNVYLSFTNPAAGNVSLGLSNISTGGAYVVLQVYNSSGGYINDEYCSSSETTCGLDLPNLPAGTYQIIASPWGNFTMSFTAEVSTDLAGTLSPNAPTMTTIQRYGQTETLSFSATAGQTVALEASSVATTPSGNSVYYYVATPDGKSYANFNTSNYGLLNLANLPQTGTYTVYAVPNYGAELSGQLELLTGVTGTLAINGPSQNFSTSATGEDIYLSFTNPVAGNVSLGLSNISTAGYYVVVQIYNSNGSLINSEDCVSSETTCGLDLQNLPAGTYQIIASPWGNYTMSFTAEVSTDLTGTLSPNTPTVTTIQRYGQTETLSFSATAGQTVALEASSVTTVPSGNSVYYYVSTPDGKSYTNFYTSSYGLLNLPNLPQTGTYTVYVVPNYGAQLSGQLELLTGVTGTLAMDGPSQNFSTPATGQNVYLTFANPAAGNVSLGLSNISTAGYYVQVQVYDSNGSYINGEYCTSSNITCGLDLPNLPAGTYRVIASPWGNYTMSFTAEVSTDLTGTLSLDAPTTTTIPRYGQTETLSFNANIGDTVALEASSVTTTPSGNSVYYYINTPDGKKYTSFFTSNYGLLNLPNLPQTGNYTVYVVPNNGATLTGQLELLTGVTGTLAINGPSQSFSTSATGENIYLSFTHPAAGNVSLRLSNISTAGYYVQVQVYNSSGSNINGEDCTSSNTTCGLDLPNLPAGTYQIIASPWGNYTMSFSAALTSP